jgi:hypothetical protein
VAVSAGNTHCGIDAVEVCSCGTHGYKGIHTGITSEKCLCTSDIEVATGDHHRGGEQKLQQCEVQGAGFRRDEYRQPGSGHDRHSKYKQRDRKQQ